MEISQHARKTQETKLTLFPPALYFYLPAPNFKDGLEFLIPPTVDFIPFSLDGFLPYSIFLLLIEGGALRLNLFRKRAVLKTIYFALCLHSLEEIGFDFAAVI